ncbi:hybrid sensor histidine kinase/response regulator transcription factor [Draconibacterium mangrovi]|uniref:hybrid sensor histidine kinase/response regulator transcription factor n=1 Tax=Draconibacterium mangrovi TaxID=2697469 RepID=UPI0013CF737A|nr:hybrid sensor histidine kinase/response regulator transcription factor [Draconibacterium mangrovi]
MKRTLFLILFFAFAVLARGESDSAKESPTESGIIVSAEISNQYISSFAEDAFGHIWIGTIRGLNKFNINEYHQYFNTEDSLSISNNRIQQVYTDSKKRLWIATVDGVCRYNDQDCFDRIPIESSSSNALYFFEDNDGKLFLNLNFEICVYNEEQNKFEPVIRDVDYQNVLSSCFVDKSNNIWIVTPSLIKCYNSHNYQLKQELKRDKYTTFSYLDENGKLWLSSWQSLEIYDTRTGKYTEVPKGIAEHPVLKDAIIYRMHPYNNSSVLILTQKDGIFLYNKLTETIIHQSESGFPFNAPDFDIVSIFTDSQKNLWIGSFDQGYKVIYHYKERFNNNQFLQSKLKGKSVLSVATDHDKNLWIVTRSDGIMLYRNDNHEIQHFTNQEIYAFWDSFQHTAGQVFIGSDNTIWVLSDWMLLKMRLEKDKLALKKYYYFPTGLLSITEDAKGNIWLGGKEQSIFVLNKGETAFEQYHLYGKEYNFTPALLTLSSGNILVASFNHELQLIDAATREVTAIPIRHLIKKTVFVPVCLFEDAVGDVWIGTINNGVYRLSTKNNTIDQINGIGCTDISSITEDVAGNIWVGTLFGLSKFDRTTQHFINYYAIDGIGGNQFNEKSVCRLSDNTLVFGGTHGLTFFNPIDINYKQNIPLVFENLKIHNKIEQPAKSGSIDKHLSYNPDITLNHNQNSFTISFSAIDYGEYERVKYAYKMVGYDNVWIEANSSRQAYYSNLPAGKYTFRVKIFNNENTITETQNEIFVQIKPAPWFSWPAISLYTILFLCIVVLVVRMQRRIKTNKDKALKAEIETEQEHKVNKMNMSFFANLSHEFRTPLTMISGPVTILSNDTNIKDESKQLIYMIQRSVNRMLRLVNQLMDFNKLENDTLKLKVESIDIISGLNRTIDIFKLNAKEKEIDLNTYGLEDEFLMWTDLDKLEKIVTNLLINAIKFCGPKGKIGINFDVVSREDIEHAFPLTVHDASTQWVKVAISDTGKGIPEDKLEKIFERYYQLNNQTKEYYNWGTGIGLYYSRRLVEIHHGFIKASNNDEGGATFTFVLPVSQQAYSPEERQPESETRQNEYIPYPPENDYKYEFSKESTTQKQKLLIIDDESEIVHYLKALLSPHYEVNYKFDADSAYKALNEIEPDLILCDVVMPGTDGYAFSRQVKESLSFSHIPIILVTAKATVENQVEGLNSGADAYVTKPFDPNYLLALINSQLSNRKKTQRMLVGVTKTEKIEQDILTPQDKNFMSELYKLMENELSNSELNINRMTEVLKISRTKFYYKVKGLTGENPGTLFKTYKLNRAAELILEGNMNISEIADMTGFSTPSHFSVSFKKHFGVSPKNYHG